MVTMLWLYLVTNNIINMQDAGAVFAYLFFFYVIVDIVLFGSIADKIGSDNTKDL